MRTSRYAGVLFIEGTHPLARPLRRIRVRLQGHLRNLDHVKEALAARARRAGANCVVAFEYGQRQRRFGCLALHPDLIEWYGSGVAAVLPPEALHGDEDERAR